MNDPLGTYLVNLISCISFRLPIYCHHLVDVWLWSSITLQCHRLRLPSILLHQGKGFTGHPNLLDMSGLTGPNPDLNFSSVVKFGPCEKGTKFQKIFHFEFDPTEYRQILRGRFFEILCPSQKIQTLL